MDCCPGPGRGGHPELERLVVELWKVDLLIYSSNCRLVVEARKKRAGQLSTHLGFSSRNSHQAVPLILVYNFGGKVIVE